MNLLREAVEKVKSEYPHVAKLDSFLVLEALIQQMEERPLRFSLIEVRRQPVKGPRLWLREGKCVPTSDIGEAHHILPNTDPLLLIASEQTRKVTFHEGYARAWKESSSGGSSKEG